jgi:hypothetical protein
MLRQQLSLICAESSGQWSLNGDGAWSGGDGETGRLGGLPALTYGAVLNGGAVANGGLPNGLPAKGKKHENILPVLIRHICPQSTELTRRPPEYCSSAKLSFIEEVHISASTLHDLNLICFG